MGTLPLTVVVAVYNGEPTLASCLERAYASEFRDFEIIVVDDASTDNTYGVARSFPCEVIRHPQNLGPAAARNTGAARASGSILYFLDADILVKKDTFSRVVQAFADDPASDALFGSFEADTPAANFVSVYKNLLHHYTHQTGNEDAATFCGGFGAMRRDVFFEAGEFDPAWRYMEDVELGYRLHRAGRRIRLLKELQVTHLKRYSLASLVRSDVIGRAIPWTRLMLRSRVFRNDLNTRVDSVLSVPVAGLLPVAAPLLGAWWVLFLAVLFLGLNRGFLGYTWRRKGAFFTAGAAAMAWFGYIYSGAGAAIGVGMHLRDRLRERLISDRAPNHGDLS